MSDTVLARLVALKTTPTADLKRQWRDLFDSEPPPYNRRYLESRLSYRIQELTYGGLKPETVKRLEALARGVEETNPVMPRMGLVPLAIFIPPYSPFSFITKRSSIFFPSLIFR